MHNNLFPSICYHKTLSEQYTFSQGVEMLFKKQLTSDFGSVKFSSNEIYDKITQLLSFTLMLI